MAAGSAQELTFGIGLSWDRLSDSQSIVADRDYVILPLSTSVLVLLDRFGQLAAIPTQWYRI